MNEETQNLENENVRAHVSVNLEQFVLPLLDKLKKRSHSSEKKLLEALEEKLLGLTENFGSRISNKKWKLSRREIEICDLIRRGLRSKEIAEILFTSIKTIEHHRNRIRKKLGISKANVDLAEYLKSLP